MLASFAFGACAEDDAGVGAGRASLAEGCLLNTDCTAPLACAFRKCHLECTSSRDCEPGQLCVPSEKPFYVCQLPTEVKCRYNSQCAGSQVCGVDGKCRQECVSERDCLPEQKCTQATCAEPAELSAGKLPVVSTVSGAAGAPSGGSCRYAEDCPPTLSCRAGQCMAECLGDRDCVSPKACTAGRCALPLPPDGSTPPAGYGNGCNLNSDCGEVLVCGKAGLCVYACNTAADCASECCQAHSCAAPSACGLVGGGGDAGTSGSGGAGGGGAGSGGGGKGGGVGKGGNAGQSGGGGAPSNPCDADDDGYIAAGGDCGGDDCDDGSAKIHPMAKERCDGLDNDCDGEIDENAWTTQGAFVVPHDAGGKLVDRVNGPPGLAVLPGNPPRIFLSYSDIPEGKEGRVLLQELDEKLVAKGALSVLEPELGGLKTTLATDGTTLAIAVSTYFGGTGKSSVRATTFAPDVPPTSLPIISPEGGRETRPALVWTGSRFAMFWSDTSVTTRRLYRSSASAGGAFASPLLVYSDAAKVADSYVWWPAVAAGAGDGTVAAYARISGKGAFVLFPNDLSSTLFDNADTGGDVWPGAVGKVGADWIGLGSVGSTNTILQLDGKTAKLSASRSLSLDASGTFGDVLPLSPQTALVAWNAYQSVKWALVPLGLGTNGETDPLKQAPLGIGELESTTAVSAPTLARIDDTHIALVWQDTELRAALLECTP